MRSAPSRSGLDLPTEKRWSSPCAMTSEPPVLWRGETWLRCGRDQPTRLDQNIVNQVLIVVDNRSGSDHVKSGSDDGNWCMIGCNRCGMIVCCNWWWQTTDQPTVIALASFSWPLLLVPKFANANWSASSSVIRSLVLLIILMTSSSINGLLFAYDPLHIHRGYN